MIISILVFVIFSYIIIYLWIKKKIYEPVPSILEKIRALKQFETFADRPEQLMSELPDFWNAIEQEIMDVQHFFDDSQHSEEKIQKALKRLINYLPMPSLITKPDGKVILANQAFCKEFKNIERGNVLPLLEIFREPDFVEFFREALDEKKASSREMKLKPEGSQAKRDYIVIKIPYAKRNEAGLRDVLMIFSDVTEMRRLDRVKTDFVSNVSHELRTPLTSISGYVQSMKEDVKNKDYAQIQGDLVVIEENVARLNFLVQDLLQLSTLESDVELPKNKENLRLITQNALKPFSAEIQNRNFKLKESYLVEELNCDGRLVEQVITNLIQNALRYTPQGTEIQLEWSKENSHVNLICRDNGPGIAAEHIPRLFERFYRIDPHRSRDRGGTGLGLAIVKHIMQKHGGTVTVRSELGKGIEFVCRF